MSWLLHRQGRSCYSHRDVIQSLPDGNLDVRRLPPALLLALCAFSPASGAERALVPAVQGALASAGGAQDALASAADAAAAAFSPARAQRLLQAFVAKAYLKGFRHLGDENDFDHAHLLFASSSGTLKPAGILYHTQELARLYSQARPGSKYDYVDREARNWIQWLDHEDRVENANRYRRARYPESRSWRLFAEIDEPRYREYHTITEKMLDPELLGFEVSLSRQWEFRRVACPAARVSDDPIEVILPTNERVCLHLRGS